MIWIENIIKVDFSAKKAEPETYAYYCLCGNDVFTLEWPPEGVPFFQCTDCDTAIALAMLTGGHDD